MTLFLSYTGYLLPWDQLAFWAITVGTNIISYVPVLGRPIRFLLLGGHIIGQNALLRFYVLHCVILPLAAVALIAVHFWRIQKDGGLTVRDDHEREEYNYEVGFGSDAHERSAPDRLHHPEDLRQGQRRGGTATDVVSPPAAAGGHRLSGS